MPTKEELQEQLSALQQENTKLKANQKPEQKAPVNPSDFLPEATAREYELNQWTGGHRQDFGRFGTIDLTKLTPQRAAALVAKGFKKLRKKNVSV